MAGVTRGGQREVTGRRIAENAGAKFRLPVMNEPSRRVLPREVVQERPRAEPVGVVRRVAGPVATARLRGPGLVKPMTPRKGTRAGTRSTVGA